MPASICLPHQLPEVRLPRARRLRPRTAPTVRCLLVVPPPLSPRMPANTAVRPLVVTLTLKAMLLGLLLLPLLRLLLLVISPVSRARMVSCPPAVRRLLVLLLCLLRLAVFRNVVA